MKNISNVFDVEKHRLFRAVRNSRCVAIAKGDFTLAEKMMNMADQNLFPKTEHFTLFNCARMAEDILKNSLYSAHNFDSAQTLALRFIQHATSHDLDNPFDIKSDTPNDMVALLWAVQNNYQQTACMLLESGVDPCSIVEFKTYRTYSFEELGYVGAMRFGERDVQGISALGEAILSTPFAPEDLLDVYLTAMGDGSLIDMPQGCEFVDQCSLNLLSLSARSREGASRAAQLLKHCDPSSLSIRASIMETVDEMGKQYLDAIDFNPEKCKIIAEVLIQILAFSVDMPLPMIYENSLVDTFKNSKGTLLQTIVDSVDMPVSGCALSALSKMGVDISRADEHGRNILHFAAMKGSVDLVSHLIASGMSLDARDARGFTPEMYARENKHTDVVHAIHSWRARSTMLNMIGPSLLPSLCS